MTDTVKDSEGQTFLLDTSGRARADVPSARPDLRVALSRAASARAILDDPDNRDAMVQALVELGLCRADQAATMAFEELAPLFTQAVTSGAITLVPYEPDLRPIADTFSLGEPQELPTDFDEPVLRPTHTLEIELVGEDDGPIPNEPYEVELPGGQIIKGRLNALGRALLTGITDPGSCSVTFPGLDQEAWEPI